MADYLDSSAGRYPEKQASELDAAWATWSLLAILAGMFIYESNACGKPVDGELSASTLLALGALSRDLVSGGQWFRAFTSIFLHADPMHFLLNGVALFLTGKLEFIIGRAWFLLVFMLSGLGGSLLSLATSDASQVSVGASGAILGLLAAQIVVAYARYEEQDETRKVLLNRGWGVLIPTLAQFAGTNGSKIDFAAHIGGAATGAIVACLILWAWDWRCSKAARVGAWGLGLAGAAIAFWGIWLLHSTACAA